MATQPAVSDKTVLEQLNEQYIEALMAGNVDWYRRHLAEDFVCIESDGSILDKAAFLQRTAQGPSVADYTLELVHVRIYGGVALIRATGSFRRKDGGSGRSQYTDIYVRTKEGWRVVSAQITRVRA
jgi:ketosteroid isomerase-like protein